MKRKQREASNKPTGKICAIDSGRLARVRGGGGLGITVVKVDLLPLDRQMQHNEALVRLRESP